MKNILLLVSITISLSSFVDPPKSFYQSQMSFPKVREAVRTKGKVIDDLLSTKGISTTNFEVFFRAFKKEQIIEVWAKNKSSEKFTLLKTYSFCATTGNLGPKRRSGDRQMPEGFYHIDAFNPQSEYYLSFRVSYPNASDLKFADPVNPGDNIFIHGSCLTIGCIPVGDEMIKELYILAIRAKSNGQQIPVHIFPTKLTDTNLQALQQANQGKDDLINFWTGLQAGFSYFENSQKLPNIQIDNNGRYLLK
ncbi:L,D-transpeptidase family protein [Flectobacillus major]|jgi:murein L,D-transpeptidase YafK|uniref:L,D-transpeptidase family protein n=1 Tax=Flectobacillus major TaxID=103 RepID=UPI0004291626|nr:L,D-transpeptidase family protein [Flectobacillus major]